MVCRRSAEEGDLGAGDMIMYMMEKERVGQPQSEQNPATVADYCAPLR